MDNVKETLIHLISIPSVTASPSEKKAIMYLEEILKEEGIETERIYKDPERLNLLAHLPAEKPEKEPLVLISHVDVVDGDADKWNWPVFGGVEDGGRIYGRGTLDTKHLTVMELNAFLNLKRSGRKLKRDVYFLATIDEEAGSTFGMEYVKKAKPDLFVHAAVINEGGGFPLRINGKDYMMVTVGEKAVCKVKLSASGRGGHASAPGGDQAILKLAAVLEEVFGAEAELDFGSHATQETMARILGSRDCDNPVAADIFGYSGQNTIGLRDYRIGDRSNVIPAAVEVVLEFKVLPGTRVEEIEAFIRRHVTDGVQYEIMSFERGFESNFDNSALKSVIEDLKTISREEGFSCEVLPMLALGRTDGRFFGSEGSMVYGCSPLLMDDSFDVVLPKVHGNDESISTESYLFGCRVLDRFIEKNCL
ncbi:MAG: M20/M25/M40 family metallo-hydrolase [Hungatella hathewayi]|uniref:M20/M25/M40 family metallo-hydrolase n=1 Tax=Hungatella TaxID=1649459 RepID=UPI001106BAA0|nr:MULTISPECIES: M20/M25/M40 family metallo-hydrolase [Hungatella]MCI7384269.1 M20/M25/M40 family metallo-hydrolase [Hungatella sp.]MDY6239339.1 M20/M25/M40 family metallo-hydrolase [Hungatella hathewayi]